MNINIHFEDSTNKIIYNVISRQVDSKSYKINYKNDLDETCIVVFNTDEIHHVDFLC